MNTPASHTPHTPADSRDDIEALRAAARAQPGDAAAQMRLGAALHRADEPERALAAFESALALAPADLTARSACAAVLLELSRPQAAYAVLSAAREALMRDAEGATNLAIAAETIGRIDEARACYAAALRMDPDNVRALNNTSQQAARDARWDIAVENAARCVELAGGVPAFWVNLVDMLAGARNFPAALSVIAQGLQNFPDHVPLRLREVVVLAFEGHVEQSEAALAALGPGGPDLLNDYLDAASPGDAPIARQRSQIPNARELFALQAYVALQQCDWRYNARLEQSLRTFLADAERTGERRDCRDTHFYGLALDLHEDEVGRLRQLSGQSLRGRKIRNLGPYLAPRRGTGERIRLGIMVQDLRDPRVANALTRQMALHDRSRFDIHLYSCTANPQAWMTEPLRPYATTITETAHLQPQEAIARIRLDELDLYMDTTFYSSWCRPEITFQRVARVQIAQLTWQRHEPSLAHDYNMSDRFVHPDDCEPGRYGPIVRLPHTVWPYFNDDAPAAGFTRADAGLADDALVLCAMVPTVMIDPATFALWMRLLRALSDAVLLMPSLDVHAQVNLRREAAAAGVDASRLVFTPQCERSETLARLALADLFVDSLRFNANHGLVDALRMGVPAVTRAGQSMAARLGGSIVRAAGLPQCVFDDVADYEQTVLRLGRDRPALAALRAALAAARPTAPLWDAAARIREWESAWITMVERERAGLAPAGFDVPPAMPTASALSPPATA